MLITCAYFLYVLKLTLNTTLVHFLHHLNGNAFQQLVHPYNFRLIVDGHRKSFVGSVGQLESRIRYAFCAFGIQNGIGITIDHWLCHHRQRLSLECMYYQQSAAVSVILTSCVERFDLCYSNYDSSRCLCCVYIFRIVCHCLMLLIYAIVRIIY